MMVFVCRRCGNKTFASSHGRYICRSCHRGHDKEDFFLDDDFKRPDEFNVDVHKELLGAGRHKEASVLLQEYQDSMNKENAEGRRRIMCDFRNEVSESRYINGLCKRCGVNPIFRAGLCEAHYKRKQEQDKESYKITREKKMNEQMNMGENDIFSVVFQKSRKEDIPYGKSAGSPSAITLTAIRELRSMSVGEVLKIPLGEKIPAHLVDRAKNKYAYSCRIASKKVEGSFRVMERGKDIFVERYQ